MNEVILSNNNLPSNIEDLSKFALIGREKLVAVRAEIRAIKKVGMAKEVREQKLAEAQQIAEIVLDAEAKIGELLRELPQEQKGGRVAEINRKTAVSTDFSQATKQSVKREFGITDKQAQRYEQLADAKDKGLLDRVKDEAKQKNTIATRESVLSMVRTEKEKELKEERKQATQEQINAGSHNIDIYTTEKKYRVIYADPPWQYNDKQNTEYHGGAEKYYPTMPIDEIATLPIGEITEKNAVLFLWVTSPMLEDCFKVINGWGFKYKTSFVWDKVKTGMGHYNSVRHEFLLVCTKGSCTPDSSRKFDSVVSIPRSDKHSEKPIEIRDMIAELYEGKKIELFARNSAEGWDCWGNMV